MIISKVVTLAATAAAIVDGTYDGTRYAMRVWLQPDPANSHPVYVGPSGVTTSTGIYLGIPATGVPPEPFLLEGTAEQPIDLATLYVLGTAAEKLRVVAITV